MKTNMTVATLVMIALALAGTLLFGGSDSDRYESRFDGGSCFFLRKTLYA